MNDVLKAKLKTLPGSPGVYFHKDESGQIIYIGKAAVLKNRVRQYFQKSRTRDPKTEALVAEIHDTEWIETESEIDALFLEAEMVKRYLPRFNILLRDDKSLLYVKIDIKSDAPTVIFTRRPLDDGAEYFGPYLEGYQVRKALRMLRRVFPYATAKETKAMGSRLYEQIGLDPGLKSGKTNLDDYRRNLRRLMSYLRGNRVAIADDIEKDMKLAAKNQEFERAAMLRNKLREMKALRKQIIFSDREFMDISKDRGLNGLSQVLGIDPPRRIEGYDISHMSGTDTVASMVVFTGGIPDKTQYRKFKMRLKGNNDFAHMKETLTRRLGAKNVKSWGLPSLFLIDGGKGQLSSSLDARDAAGITVPMIGIAKQEEQIVIHKTRSNTFPSIARGQASSKGTAVDETEYTFEQQVERQGGRITESEDFILVNLPHGGDVVKLLQRIRDESHRFAVTYHTSLKRGRQLTSWLDDVPGIGPATKKKLLRQFGSSKGVKLAAQEEIAAAVGPSIAKKLLPYK